MKKVKVTNKIYTTYIYMKTVKDTKLQRGLIKQRIICYMSSMFYEIKPHEYIQLDYIIHYDYQNEFNISINLSILGLEK